MANAACDAENAPSPAHARNHSGATEPFWPPEQGVLPRPVPPSSAHEQAPSPRGTKRPLAEASDTSAAGHGAALAPEAYWAGPPAVRRCVRTNDFVPATMQPSPLFPPVALPPEALVPPPYRAPSDPPAHVAHGAPSPDPTPAQAPLPDLPVVPPHVQAAWLAPRVIPQESYIAHLLADASSFRVSIRVTRGTLSFLLAGARLTVNGIRVEHIPDLNDIVLPEELRFLGLHVQLPTDVVVKAVVLWMARPLDSATLVALGLGMVKRLRTDSKACGDVFSSFFRRGTSNDEGRQCCTCSLERQRDTT